jgi:hypothetical protein
MRTNMFMVKPGIQKIRGLNFAVVKLASVEVTRLPS